MTSRAIDVSEPSHPTVITDAWTTAETCRYLRRSTATVRRLERDGLLHPIPGPMAPNGKGNVRYFEPDEVRELGKSLPEIEESERGTSSSESIAKANAVRDIVGQSADLTRESWDLSKDLIDRFLKNNEKNTDQVLSALLKENARLQARCDTLESRKDDVEDAREAIRAELYDRTVASAQADREMKKTEVLADSFNMLVSAAIARFVGGEKAGNTTVARFIKSITKDQLEKFQEIPWDEKQIIWLQTMFDSEPTPETSASNGASSTTNGSPTPSASNGAGPSASSAPASSSAPSSTNAIGFGWFGSFDGLELAQDPP
jgi:hypothetical protein